MAKTTDLSSLENAPKTLETNKIIRRFYKDLMVFAEQQNKATEADKLAAMMIADMFFIYKEAQLALFNPETGEPEVVIQQIGDKGQVRRIPNPAIKVMDDTHKRIMDGLRDFGMTPKSRKQVEQLEEHTESELLKFLKGE
ncbi:hypothetical protein BBM40_01045 [Vibrio parahaemolyticus]|uniref:P27 family phage terminase small subunit n=1 Tax=Vibrio parahaemolyticus TaxID=670 RepID=UPI00084B9891|nr:P27 family phage terminase small subunit [Vibrio parahaemolyticus]MDF5001049.1 P27 family phage terminase small subunit [Vibrio parahaemolyticus]ODZ55717.1 hypothetical protein BBM40_01045 [Vibrio parahaemolyticus]HCG5938588.1 P27 family phage terminase small subunit [Vibrio parahaemolyticus]